MTQLGQPGPCKQSLQLHFFLHYPEQRDCLICISLPLEGQTAQMLDRRTELEAMGGKKGMFWTLNKRPLEMLKMGSSFVSNHRNTCTHTSTL